MFADLSEAELKAMLESLARCSEDDEITAYDWADFGFSAVAKRKPPTMKQSAALHMINQLLSAKREIHSAPNLVWSGPQTSETTSRDTSIIIRDLFLSAEKEVWMSGYSIRKAKKIFQPLADVMNQRGVKTNLLLHFDNHEKDPEKLKENAQQQALKFLHKQWTFDGAKPTIFGDLRTVQDHHNKRKSVSMHAKFIVVDAKTTLIGSANLTSRAMNRNIEAGALIHDPKFAQTILRQLDALIHQGDLEEVL